MFDFIIVKIGDNFFFDNGYFGFVFFNLVIKIFVFFGMLIFVNLVIFFVELLIIVGFIVYLFLFIIVFFSFCNLFGFMK